MNDLQHPWMPLSPCVAGCIDPAPRTVGRRRIAARFARLIGIVTTFPVAFHGVPRSCEPAVVRGYAAAMLRQLGVSLEVVDNRGEEDRARRGTLVVAGHISWVDGLAVAAVTPATFVGKADITETFPLDSIARWLRLIPIRREDLRGLPGVIDEVCTRLESGRDVAVFPEGTTWCGRGSGTFRPAIFDAAVRTGAPVQPLRIEYLNPDGTTNTTTGFVGDDTVVASVRRLLAADGIRVRVTLLPLEEPGPDRRELAARCAAKIQGAAVFDFAAHGVLQGSRNTPRIPATV